MRRIPNFVLRRNRINGYAQEQFNGYKERPRKTGGLCQRCGKDEEYHDLGLCDNLKTYLPPATEKPNAA